MALPELYKEQEFQRQTFDRNSQFIKHNPNLTARGTRKFNRYWDSDQRLEDEKAFNAEQDAAELAHIQAEAKKRAESWDARIAALREQNAARGAATLKNINASLAAKPAIPAEPSLVLKDAARWNQVASQYGFNDYNAVAAWQKENGLEADGKFGAASYAKWAQLNPDKVGTVPVIKPRIATPVTPTNQTTPLMPEGYVELSRPDGTTFLQGNKSEFTTQVPTAYTPTNTTNTSKGFDINAFAEHYKMPILTVGNKKYVRYDPQGLGDYYVDDSGKLYEYGSSGKVGSYLEEPTSIRFDGKGANEMGAYRKIKEFYKKQGGIMNRINYFQQGGAAPQQQDIKAQVVALVQAAMQGDQKATQQVNQIMEAAKAGDQQAMQIAQIMEQVVKEMQGQAVAAKYGAKLDYLQSLKCGGKAKAKKKEQGGKVCPECEKQISKHQYGGTALAQSQQNAMKIRQGQNEAADVLTRGLSGMAGLGAGVSLARRMQSKPSITLTPKHQSGGVMGFYRGWSKDDIKKLQMFLSREDMLGDNAYQGELDGIMGPKTIAAIKAYQKSQGVTADGMWGTNTNKHHKVMGISDVVAKSPYKKSHRYEAGNFVKHPTAYSELTWHDLPKKNVADAIAYFSAYPEMLFSEDMEASKWRQIFHNSGKDGADFINQIFASLSPEQRKLVDDRRLTESYKIDRMQRQINEKRNEFAGNLLPALVAPVAGALTLSALTGGAAAATIGGLAGGYAGSQIFGEVGRRAGRKRGIKNKNKLYTDPVADKYGVASAVYDPNRRIAEAEQKGQAVGSLVGSVVGGYGGAALGTATENAVINTIGAGRAAYAPKTQVVVETTPSVSPYGTVNVGTVKGPSSLKLFTEGVKARLSTGAGQTRAGGVYGVKHRYNGKTYNPGNWMDDATVARARQDWYNPLSPSKMNIGGPQNTGRGVKIGNSLGVNWTGVGAQTAINTPTHVVGTTIANQGDVVLDPTDERE